MTAKEIQFRLIRDRYMQSVMFPNYTPPQWWECDVFELTKAGYFREYEIKMSRSDFRADAKKERVRFNWSDESRAKVSKNKHNQLLEGCSNGPAQFWFVSIPGIIPVEEIPSFAGLIIFEPNEHNPDRWFPSVIKKAPRLHSVKAEQSIRDDLLRTCYFRFQWQFIQQHKQIN